MKIMMVHNDADAGKGHANWRECRLTWHKIHRAADLLTRYSKKRGISCFVALLRLPPPTNLPKDNNCFIKNDNAGETIAYFWQHRPLFGIPTNSNTNRDGRPPQFHGRVN